MQYLLEYMVSHGGTNYVGHVSLSSLQAPKVGDVVWVTCQGTRRPARIDSITFEKQQFGILHGKLVGSTQHD
jgi:hypothetical protein